ncbi:zinc-binding loop region of homing endonuclease-domain-containing protein [Daldinia loculata]|nr:zinc-binding loop region of homing endonuclease-domain-containing protein [Daldinia loculata]KAI2778474.1 zinc-binding loop region of homing endonuclease-domain-containing protein [Daldinia loculata]
MSSSSANTSAPASALTRVEAEVSSFIQSLRNGDTPQEVQAQARQLWGEIQSTITNLEGEIRQLRGEVRVATAVRPDTAQSTHAERLAFLQSREEEALQSEEASATVEAICDLPPEWVMQFLQKRRAIFVDNGLGCWVSNAPLEPNGREKINLRNTKAPEGAPNAGQSIGCQPWAYQLAFVATGEGHLLRTTTTDRGSHVSHLCHHANCFNPYHLVVEPGWLNLARNECQGKRIIVCPDGTKIHPCPHIYYCTKQACLLPEFRVPPEWRGKYIEVDVSGEPIFRDRNSEGEA